MSSIRDGELDRLGGSAGARRRGAVWLMAWAVFLVAACLALGMVWVKREQSYLMLDEPHKIAVHLVLGHGYLTPLEPSAEAPATAWIPPVFPYLLCGVYKVLGIQTHAAFNAMLGLISLWYGFFVMGVFVLGRLVFSRAAGVAAAILVGLNPLFLLRLIYIWETYLSLAIFVWLAVLAVLAVKFGALEARKSLAAIAWIGAGMGVLVLTNASYVLALPVLVWVALRAEPMRRKLTIGTIAFVVFGAILLPWTIRNYNTFGKMYLVRSGFPLELWLGNQPGSSGWQDLDGHPSTDYRQGRRMVEMGEVAYFRECGEKFKQIVREDQMRFVGLTCNRVAYLFVGDPSEHAPIGLVKVNRWGNRARVALDVLVLAMGLGGMWLSWRSKRPAGWLLVLGMACGVGYVMSHVNYRYALPVRMVMLIYGGYLAAAVWEWIRSGERFAKGSAKTQPAAATVVLGQTAG